MKKIIIILLIVAFLGQYSMQAQRNEKDTLKIKAREITVSGLRYPEKLMEVPLAITKINQYELINLKGYNLSEPLTNVPGLLVQERSGTPDVRITIRGFGARGAGDRSNSGTSRGLKFYLNGAPLTEPDGRTSFDFIEPSFLTDIEILRSNASAIWGNAAGGVISFRTMPELITQNLNVQFATGSYGFKKYGVSAGKNFANGLFYANAMSTTYDGYRQNSNGERYLIDFGYSANLDDKSKLEIFVDAAQNKFNIPGPITQAAFDTNYFSANPNYLARKERRENRLLLMGANFENYIDDNNVLHLSVYANPKYLQRSERGTYRDFTRYHLGGNINFRNTMNFSDNIKNIVLVGADEQYQDGAILFYKLTPDANRGDTLQTNKKEGANIAGIYFQDEIIYDETISILLGLRYDVLTYYNQNFMKLNQKEQKDFTKLTPKFGISYRLTPENTLYFNIGGGVEVPAGNETDPDPINEKLYLINPLLNPIESQTFEIGTKSNFNFNNDFIKNIFWDFAGYYIQTKNDIIPYSGGRFYMSAGKTSRIGLETFLDFSFNYGLSLSTAFTFMNSKYDEYKIDSVYYDISKKGVYADFKDNKVAGIPDFFYKLNLNYTPNYFDYITLNFGVQGVSSYFSDDANKYEVPSYNIINAKISTTHPLWLIENIGVNLFLALNNLTDSKYASSAFINPDLEKKTNAPFFLEPGIPRNFAFGFEIKWK